MPSKTSTQDMAKLFPARSYLNMFFAEKDLPYKVFSVDDSRGLSHEISNEVVIEAISGTSGGERKQIEDTIRKIDFKNGDVNHFLEHLAKGLAEQYAGVMRFASPLIRLASTFPKGSSERRTLLAFAKSASFSPGQITVRNYQGTPSEVPALVMGSWGVHKGLGGKGWAVTHGPSGKSLANVSSRRKGQELVEQMVESEPSLLNASESQLQGHQDLIMSLVSGVLPFEKIFRDAGFRNLGERYGKRGDHWGLPEGTLMIRVGGRDLILSEYNILGWKESKGRMQPEVRWGMVDGEDQKKVTRPMLDAWIRRVKAAPTRAEVIEDFRGRNASEKTAAQPLMPGAILASSWGYNQTNVSFYEVLAVTKASAMIQKVESRVVGSKAPDDLVVPVPGRPRRGAKPMQKRVRPDGSVKITSYENAYPWDGKPERQTMAGYGH